MHDTFELLPVFAALLHFFYFAKDVETVLVDYIQESIGLRKHIYKVGKHVSLHGFIRSTESVLFLMKS